MLTITGLLGLLVALLLPAVQSARESSRRVACANHLRQVGLAVQSYHATNGLLPSPSGHLNHESPPGRRLVDIKDYSIFTQMLPELGEAALFNACNFQVAMTDPRAIIEVYGDRGIEANATVFATSLAVLLCPSDGRPAVARGPSLAVTAGANYRANLGAERWYFSRGGPFADDSRPASFASIADGLSQTVGFSEKLRGRVVAASIDPRADFVVFPVARSFDEPIDAAVSRCREQGLTELGFRSEVGLCWFSGDLGNTCYNHTMTPNNVTPDCGAVGSSPNGLFAARSNHPTGVHAGMMDGSVRFVRATVAPPVWRAIGTRAAGEVVAADSY